MPKSILITGGSGLIGSLLTKILKEAGYEVRWLTRNISSDTLVKQYKWNIEKGSIDYESVIDVEAIIHLAGASVAGHKWTKKYKKVLFTSRINSCNLLFEACVKTNSWPSTFICSSAIGYYGNDSGSVWKKESSQFGNDFLANLTKEWEDVSKKFTGKSRVVNFRTGIVLSPDGGSLDKMLPIIKLGLGSPLGKGDQYMSWIHENDVVNAYKFAVENTIEGPFNLVAPDPVTNKKFMKTLASVLKKPFFLPAVPSFVLKMVLGKMSVIVTGSTRASSEKLVESGFIFEYSELETALRSLKLK